MARLNKVYFVINFLEIDRRSKMDQFLEVREYIGRNYPNDLCVIDMDRYSNARIVMYTTKDIRQNIVDKFDLRYTGNRTSGWMA